MVTPRSHVVGRIVHQIVNRARATAGIHGLVVPAVIVWLALAPAHAFAQGAMTNGESHTGAITIAGGIDVWTFTATAGDYIALSMGETGGTDTAFVPWIQLFSPAGPSLASVSGALVAQISITAATTGTYTVQAKSNDAGQNDVGTYALTLAKAPGAFVVPSGDQGGAMTNGSNHAGSIGLGDLDMWSFTATAGDYIALNIGEVPPVGPDPDFRPWIRLVGPTGTLEDSVSGVNAQQISQNVPLTGTYTVIVGTFDSGLDATGDYSLTVAKAPGTFVISGGDQGGAMTNGSNHAGAIHVGDLDMWSFTAAAGDYISVSIGEVPPVGPDPGFVPWIRLVGPTGVLQNSLSGANAQQISQNATLGGTYTVIVGSFDSGLDATGDYLLTLAKGPGAFTISGGDEGGALTNGSNHAGAIHVGDLDMWSFTATAGDYIAISIGEVAPVGPDPDFRPWIRLVRPNGTLDGSISGIDSTQIGLNAAATGTYTVIVGSNDSGLDGTGDYLLTLAKGPGVFTISGGDQGGTITNGTNAAGAIHVGDLDMWNFTATAGDYIAISMGEVAPVGPDPDFRPWIRLVRPNGTLDTSISSINATQISVNAALSGTYTVIVGTNDPSFDATGDYLLTLAKGPGAVAISPGDQGGLMTNGANHAGAIHVGDLDVWTFTAGANEAVALSVGEVLGVDNGLVPWIRLVSPAGALVGNASSATVAQLDVTTTVSGTYTVIVGSFDANLDGTGNYLVTLAKSGGFIVPAADEGGPMTTGVNHAGSIHVGDLDQWSFFAHQGNPLSVTISEAGTDVNFNPWIRLRSPTGAALGSQSGAATANISVTAPLTGFYTVVAATADVGNDATGQYLVTVLGNNPDPNIIQNGTFDSALSPWQLFATPDLSYIVANVTGGSLNYYRVAPPPGTQNQAVAFQETGVALATDTPLLAQFDLANTSSVRKRISVLVIDSNFSDLSVCTYWLPPNAPMRTYQMKTHTTKAWANAALYFYAASPGSNGGFYQVDNVSLQQMPNQSAFQTECVDPTAPAPPGGVDGPDLLVNGNFNTGTLAPWFTFGNITSQLTGGVFEFIKTTNAPPAGVILQPTGQAVSGNEILAATFDLGNSSFVRKRVTAIVHDNSFGDLSACTFWLAPNLPLSTYTVRMFATQAWTNATLSVYAATLGTEQWTRLDNATLKRTPATATVGTACLEPVPVPDAGDLDARGPARQPNGGTAAAAASRAGDVASVTVAGPQLFPASGVALVDGWLTDGFDRGVDPAFGPAWLAIADEPGTRTLQLVEPLDLRGVSGATVRLRSRLAALTSRAAVQWSTDGTTWDTLQMVPSSDAAVTVDITLGAAVGQVGYLRVVFDTAGPVDPFAPDRWMLDVLSIDITVAFGVFRPDGP